MRAAEKCKTSMQSAKISLSEEQLKFISVAMMGSNLLVDACIGSGKTTAIQRLCDCFPPQRKILYLTYNRLLKLDARAKIKRRNVTVNNYHGFAFTMLNAIGVHAGVPDLIHTFNEVKPPIPCYDVLVLDEYQDIEQELADLLEYIRSACPSLQIIAVGDMEQKIYDKTALDVKAFIERFLGDHVRLTFTKCFRLCEEHAALLGRIWKKPILGVNPSCRIVSMTTEQVISFLSSKDPKDILCLGSRTGEMAEVLNMLEDEFPNTFNKSTIFASIQDDDGNRAVDPTDSCAIFTTYDSSKGLERKICVVFDFTESYWLARIAKPQQSYEILRNIFCVAASRGKEAIVFVSNGEAGLSEESLSSDPEYDAPFEGMDISSMFDFKYHEDVEECFSLLKIAPVEREDKTEIDIRSRDELIDLSPCIGIYQEAAFFGEYNIEKELDLFFSVHPDLAFLYSSEVRHSSTEEKILFLVSLETKQDRYRKQVSTPLVQRGERAKLLERLGSVLSEGDSVQVPCSVAFGQESGRAAFVASGLADVVREGTVYELKFVSELAHPHFLQCATYMVGLGLDRGILWNTRTNTMFEISIPDKEAYLDAVVKAVTKRTLTKYYPLSSR